MSIYTVLWIIAAGTRNLTFQSHFMIVLVETLLVRTPISSARVRYRRQWVAAARTYLNALSIVSRTRDVVFPRYSIRIYLGKEELVMNQNVESL